ncbi:MAG: hypothetical protein OEX07_12240 [Gammaproteobacteria bacterium]|nr:hypothetical protein [Gammaproteobacteria bacterium]
MIVLSSTLNAWGSDGFNVVLKGELEALDAALLPLQQGLSQSSYVSGNEFSVMINRVTEDERCICVIAGVFYSGVIAGCNCADDPTPMDELAEYCELKIEIDKSTAEAIIMLSGE